MTGWRSDAWACLALSALWIAAVLVIGADGEFPISDDWAYAKTTQGLVEHGRFERVPWTWAPILSHVGVGWLASTLLGFSFETLRLSNLLLGGIGMLGAYALCRQFDSSPLWSGLGALVVGFNPIYLAISYSFMTDVPFAAFTTWALVGCARGTASGRTLPLIGGLTCAAAAALCRQPGIVLVVAVAIAMVASGHPRFRVTAALSLLALPAFWIIESLVGGAEGSRLTRGIVWYANHILAEPGTSLWASARDGVIALVYMGAFVAPLAWLPSRDPTQGRWLWIGAAAGLGFAALGFSALGLGMPATLDWIYDLGLGPTPSDEQAAGPRLAPAAWWLVASIGAASGGATLARIALGLGASKRRGEFAPWLMLGMFVALYLGVLLPRMPFFDRYLLAVLAPAVALLLASARTSGLGSWQRAALAATAMVPLAFLAVAGTHDHLERHRARWALLDALVSRSVDTKRIDGGFAFNGWYNFGPQLYPRYAGRAWVHDDAFRISIRSDLPGYRAIASREVDRLLVPGSEHVTLFLRDGEPPFARLPDAGYRLSP